MRGERRKYLRACPSYFSFSHPPPNTFPFLYFVCRIFVSSYIYVCMCVICGWKKEQRKMGSKIWPVLVVNFAESTKSAAYPMGWGLGNCSLDAFCLLLRYVAIMLALKMTDYGYCLRWCGIYVQFVVEFFMWTLFAIRWAAKWRIKIVHRTNFSDILFFEHLRFNIS